MGAFPILSAQNNKAGDIERETDRVFAAAMKEVALAREQIRRAEEMLDRLEMTARSQRRRKPAAE